MLSCVLLHPFAFHGLDPRTPLVALERGRVRHLNPVARAAGLDIGMRELAVRLKCPAASLLPAMSPALCASWEKVLEQLYAVSPNVEGPLEGVAFVTVHATVAAQLALEYTARVGRAETQELALLAAVVGSGGRGDREAGSGSGVREVAAGGRRAFLETCPLEHLSLLGLEARTLERLRFLGLSSVGALYSWSRAQVGGFFGREARLVLSVLYEGIPRISRYCVARSVTAQHTPYDTLTEPYQLEPVLEKLAGTLHTRLEGKLARRLSLTLETPLGQLGEVLLLKGTLEPTALRRALHLTLERSGALALGVCRLEATLSGLGFPGEQRGLFDLRPPVSEAVERVERRFPGAMLRPVLSNPHSQAREERFAFIPWTAPEEPRRARAARGR